ncbi:hypothetical protein NMY22_g17110 [Coprinellus aureogranulatus]|nr:hypothetical protein NMY22_g17110 [Coprinellus aureogranulatus]
MALTSTPPSPALFSPIKVGNMLLKHRVVLAPLTRFGATRSTHVPVLPMVKEYYAQRASVPGTLLITEATFIAPEARGYRYAPGVWNQEQVDAWKEVSAGRISFRREGSPIYSAAMQITSKCTPKDHSSSSKPGLSVEPQTRRYSPKKGDTHTFPHPPSS